MENLDKNIDGVLNRPRLSDDDNRLTSRVLWVSFACIAFIFAIWMLTTRVQLTIATEGVVIVKDKQLNIAATSAGRVQTVMHVTGDTVKKGELLLTLSNQNIANELRNSKRALLKELMLLQINHYQSATEVPRMESLLAAAFQQSGMSKTWRDTLESDLREPGFKHSIKAIYDEMPEVIYTQKRRHAKIELTCELKRKQVITAILNNKISGFSHLLTQLETVNHSIHQLQNALVILNKRDQRREQEKQETRSIMAQRYQRQIQRQILQLNQLNHRNQHLTVYSPSDGVILKTQVTSGTEVAKGQHLVTIEPRSGIRVITAALTRDQIDYVEVGDEVSYKLAHAPTAKPASGRVLLVYPQSQRVIIEMNEQQLPPKSKVQVRISNGGDNVYEYYFYPWYSRLTRQH